MYEASLASVLSAAPHGSVVVHSCAALERQRRSVEQKTRNRGAWAVARAAAAREACGTAEDGIVSCCALIMCTFIR